MKDVDRLLHSDAPLVVIEAAAGCGKTWTAAKFAQEMASRLTAGRVLLLSHTHGACGEFHRRCSGQSKRIDVETCDSFALKIITPYAAALNLPVPLDPAVGAENGLPFSELSVKAVDLLRRAPTVARLISAEYPVLVLDEHQDSTSSQHELAMLLLRLGGTRIRAFGDPMQSLGYGSEVDFLDWDDLSRNADGWAELDEPHRWKTSPALGEWITSARRTLRAGASVRLADAPPEVVHISASQLAGRQKFRDRALASQIIRDFFDEASGRSVAVAHLSEIVGALGQSFNWRAPVNEGAVLRHLDELLSSCEKPGTRAADLSASFLEFAGRVGTGLPMSMCKSLKQRLGDSIDRRRIGERQAPWLQALELIYEQPDHRGLANAMSCLMDETPQAYRVRLPHHVSALRALARTDDPRGHVMALSRLRRQQNLPLRTVSTIHKAKGLEFENVLICPADQNQFPANSVGGRLLYVAMSRASQNLKIVTDTASPVVHLARQS